MKKQALVIGLGFAGSVVSRILADSGYDVIALEKRAHIAGNMFEYERSNGVRVHLYGPHIFHTNNEAVFSFLNRFSGFYPYSHRVIGKIDNQLVPIPFNFTSIDRLFSKDIATVYKTKLSKAFDLESRVTISDLFDTQDPDIRDLANFVLQKVFVNYSAKQWGVPFDQLDSTVTSRVPVVIGEDDRYFSDKIQMMPLLGFTDLFERLLNHPNIAVNLNSESNRRIRLHPDSGKVLLDGIPFSGPVCYTGPIDELFDYSLGALPYRTTEFVFEDYDVNCLQCTPVINYPNEEKYTRISEFKHITLQEVPDKTTILKEYPMPYHYGSNMIPLYPIQNPDNKRKYEDYLRLGKSYSDLFFCGRLAEYKYYNMDAVVARAMQVADDILSTPKYD
ncbi:MAG: UDP-galactopyranose mutase [Clostridiaceae bacterium]|nr:UDP-galactopyranose mutase [Clostridiaceae bacterium]